MTGTLQGSFLASFLLGWGVTTGAGIASYPLDTIRRRMMMTSGEKVHYSSMFDAGRKIIAAEGVSSLFKGAGANSASCLALPARHPRASVADALLPHSPPWCRRCRCPVDVRQAPGARLRQGLLGWLGLNRECGCSSPPSSSSPSSFILHTPSLPFPAPTPPCCYVDASDFLAPKTSRARLFRESKSESLLLVGARAVPPSARLSSSTAPLTRVECRAASNLRARRAARGVRPRPTRQDLEGAARSSSLAPREIRSHRACRSAPPLPSVARACARSDQRESEADRRERRVGPSESILPELLPFSPISLSVKLCLSYALPVLQISLCLNALCVHAREGAAVLSLASFSARGRRDLAWPFSRPQPSLHAPLAAAIRAVFP